MSRFWPIVLQKSKVAEPRGASCGGRGHIYKPPGLSLHHSTLRKHDFIAERRSAYGMKMTRAALLGSLAVFAAATLGETPATAQEQKRPDIVMLMTDDTGWLISVSTPGLATERG
jgi:hypothetical protein